MTPSLSLYGAYTPVHLTIGSGVCAYLFDRDHHGNESRT